MMQDEAPQLQLLAAFNSTLQAALCEVLDLQPAARALLMRLQASTGVTAPSLQSGAIIAPRQEDEQEATPLAAAASVSLQSLAKLSRQHPEVADRLDEEVQELMAAATDVGVLKQLLRVARVASVQMGHDAAAGQQLSVQGSKLSLHAEEQEDGEERPDLDGIGVVVRPWRESDV